MQTIIKRYITEKISERLQNIEAVAILGARQVGKSTLAKLILEQYPDSVYLDLERNSDIEKLRDPESFFVHNSEKLICLDEIQRTPELFPVMRSIIDENGRPSQFLILGSASQDLIRQSSETLAGRISYIDLSTFTLNEVLNDSKESELGILKKIWLRGGFPKSYLAGNDNSSLEWRIDFIRTFLERDLSVLGFNFSALTMRRLWQMLAHSNGQTLNSSKLGASLGLSNHTIKKYVDVLEQTFMVRVLRPYETNFKKRLVKSPKVYVSDTGILHALLDIENYNDLTGHPVFGSSWECFAIHNICTHFPRWKYSFLRTSSGNEIDLILEKGLRRVAIEFKASSAPKISKGFYMLLEDLNFTESYVIAPVKDDYQYKNVKIVSLKSFVCNFEKQFS